MQAIYSAATGLKGQQTRLDTISANIANVNTVGYKSTRVDFKDALYTMMESPVGDSMEENLLKGAGVIAGASTTNFSDGSLQTTENTLDFAIIGNGFFTVENAQGETLYTRNGNLSVSIEGENNYLVTAQGHYVLNDQGQRITLPKDLSGLGVKTGGILSNEAGDIATMGIVMFPNNDGLLAVGNTCYQVSDSSGEPIAAGNVKVQQGTLENSNVDLSDELTLLIRAQRAYSLASRALRTADDMEGLANNMR